MLTKMKLALAIAAPLVAGAATYAAADSGSAAPTAAATQSQREAHHQAMLAKYDTNHDGKLDANERAVMRDDKLTARFQKLDTNHDGMVTLDEFKANAKLGHHGRHMHHRMRDTAVPGSGSAGGSGA
jgi:Ca2+-binding EF-hand superfamily protein